MMMGLAHIVKEAVRRFWAVRCFSPFEARRYRIAWDASRLYVAGRLFEKSGESKDTFMGYEISHRSRRMLSFLVDEIFIANDYYLDLGKPDPRIIDCGSNIGVSILYFKARYPEAKVTGFELHPSTHELLQRNMTSNELHNVEVHNIALSKEEGTVEFYFDEELDQGGVRTSLLASRGGALKAEIKSARLSSFIDDEVDLVKMDIEGAELEVLQELEESGKLARIRNMIIECHHKASPDFEPVGKIHDLLSRAGFSLQFECGRNESRPIGTKRGSAQDLMLLAYRSDA